MSPACARAGDRVRVGGRDGGQEERRQAPDDSAENHGCVLLCGVGVDHGSIRGRLEHFMRAKGGARTTAWE